METEKTLIDFLRLIRSGKVKSIKGSYLGVNNDKPHIDFYAIGLYTEDHTKIKDMLITIDTKNDYYQKLDVKIKACLEDIKKDYLLKHSPIADKKIKLKK